MAFQRSAAVFDLDDSLLDGNAGTVFTWYLYREGVLKPEASRKLPGIVLDFARGRLSETDMVSVASRAHAGLRADLLKDHARRCFERHLRHRVTAEGLRTVRRHLLAGRLVLLASGSPQCIVEEAARFVRAHLAVGTRTLVRGGVCTDEILAPATFREGKREHVEALCEEHGVELQRCWLYSDSAADRPLLERVGHPVVVNPDGELREEAGRRGWKVVEWKGRWTGERAEQRGAEDEWQSGEF